MEPAEKAGSGEITIAISRSILSNKRSKTARHSPDGLVAFGGNEPSQSSLRDARFPLLSPVVTFSPGRGKSVLSGGALFVVTGKCKKAPPSGELARERLRGFQTGVAHFIRVKREDPPAGRNFPPGGHLQSFSTPGHPAACHAAHSTSFSGLESFFRAASRRRAVRLSAQRSR